MVSSCFNPCAGCSAPPALLLFLMQEGEERVAEAERARQRAEQARRDLEANSGEPADSILISLSLFLIAEASGSWLRGRAQQAVLLLLPWDMGTEKRLCKTEEDIHCMPAPTRSLCPPAAHPASPILSAPNPPHHYSTARLEPLGMDRRYNRYWRIPGAEQQAQHAQHAQQAIAPEQQQQQAGEEGGEGGAAADGAPGPATPALPPPVGDRLLVESQEDGSLSLVTTKAALAALMAALERKGARESGLYASLIRHRAQLEAGMPAAPLALPAAEGEAAAQQVQQAEQAQRQTLLALHLAAPALQPRQLPGRASKKAKEAAAAEGAVEEAAAADLAPLREGDGLAVTRIKTVRGMGEG